MLAEVSLTASDSRHPRNGHHCLRCGRSQVCNLRPIFLVLQKVLVKLVLEVELLLEHLLLLRHVRDGAANRGVAPATGLVPENRRHPVLVIVGELRGCVRVHEACHLAQAVLVDDPVGGSLRAIVAVGDFDGRQESDHLRLLLHEQGLAYDRLLDRLWSIGLQ